MGLGPVFWARVSVCCSKCSVKSRLLLEMFHCFIASLLSASPTAYIQQPSRIPHTPYPVPPILYPPPTPVYPIPYTLYPVPLNPIPYTPYPKPYTLYPIPFDLYPVPCIPKPYTPYPTPYTQTELEGEESGKHEVQLIEHFLCRRPLCWQDLCVCVCMCVCVCVCVCVYDRTLSLCPLSLLAGSLSPFACMCV